MRHSTPPTATGRLTHWGVAAVAALVAMVWVAVTLVPSLAESRVPDNFPVQVPLEAKLVGAKDPVIAGKPGYNDIRDLGYADWGPEGKKVIKKVLKDGKDISRGSAAISAEYANGGIGFCVEPEEGGVPRPDDLGKGSFSVTFATPDLMPSKTRPFSMSEGDMKNIQAFTKIFNSNPDAAEPGVWMGALYSVIGGYSVTMMDQQKDTYVSNVVADVKKLAPSLETNEEKIKSLKLAVGDANGGKVVKIIGSEQAIEALKAAPDSTVKITGEGITPTEGSIKQAIGDGIPVKMTCQAGQTAKLHAEWTGPIQLTGMFAAAPYTRDQVKTVVTPQNIVINSSVDAEVPCSPTPEKPTTPAEPTPEVKAPEIATSAADQSDGDKVLVAGQDGQIVDTVTLKNLVVGATYKLEGTLMDSTLR